MSDSSLVPPVLNPSSLYKEEARRDATRIRIYNSVLTAIYNRVKAVARIPGNEKSLWYIVPEFIPGTPRFDMGDAILYIVWNLRNSGYTVSYTHPNLLFISWKSHDDYYRSVDSPWSQVLQAAKTQVVVAKETTHSPILKPQITTALEIQKRKTPLKKTVEFKPTNEMIPNLQLTTNPSIVTSMYSAQPPARLPGQLTDKHISFV
jgi:Family of unknown function (DUF5759)